MIAAQTRARLDLTEVELTPEQERLVIDQLPSIEPVVFRSSTGGA